MFQPTHRRGGRAALARGAAGRLHGQLPRQLLVGLELWTVVARGTSVSVSSGGLWAEPVAVRAQRVHVAHLVLAGSLGRLLELGFFASQFKLEGVFVAAGRSV